MARGKKAMQAASRRVHELEAALSDARDEIRRLQDEARRRDEQFAEEVRQARIAAAKSTVETNRRHLAGLTADFANKAVEAEVATERRVMTRHLLHLFLSGYIDWDRMHGDVEMLTFLHVHGDLGEWIDRLDEARGYPRKERRRVHHTDPTAFLEEIAKRVIFAEEHPRINVRERSRKMREELDTELEATRERYLAGETPSLAPKEVAAG